jgi:hypothetical protein
MTLSERRNENIVEAVVVVIADSHAHSEKLNGKPRFRGYIRKCSVVIIVIERWMRNRPMMLRPVRPIHEKKILPAVAIVIDERDARPHRLRQILFPESPIIVREMNSGRSCDVIKLDCGSRRRGKTWGRRDTERDKDDRQRDGAGNCTPIPRAPPKVCEPQSVPPCEAAADGDPAPRSLSADTESCS